MSNLISIWRKKNITLLARMYSILCTSGQGSSLRIKPGTKIGVRYRRISAGEIQHKIHADTIESTMVFSLLPVSKPYTGTL